jgi:hypothetical protein
MPEDPTPASNEDERLTMNWRVLGVVAALTVTVAVAWKLNLLAHVTAAIDSVGRRDVPPFLPVPHALPEGDVNAVREQLTADLAYEIDEGGVIVRAFAWEESDGNWTLVFYRREGADFLLFGPIMNPSGFDGPHLEGSPPALTMRDRDLATTFVFHVEDGGMAFVPSDPGVEMRENDAY